MAALHVGRCWVLREDPISEVGQREQELRNWLSGPDRQEKYLHDVPDWHRIVACLDAIGDTDGALDAFLRTQGRGSRGEWYLAIYGVLQALVLQQDAVRDLATALELPYEPEQSLKDIREVRNDAVGHPTARGAEPGRSFSALSRVSLSREGFDLLTTERSTSQHKVRRIDLPSLIHSQRSLLARSLDGMLAGLQRREKVDGS